MKFVIRRNLYLSTNTQREGAGAWLAGWLAGCLSPYTTRGERTTTAAAVAAATRIQQRRSRLVLQLYKLNGKLKH